MKNILFANAFFLEKDSKQFKEKLKPYPPLATLYAAAQVDESKYNIKLFDATFSSGINDFKSFFTNEEIDILVVCEDNFNYLSKMCLLHVREATYEILSYVKNRDIPVIINSSDATDNPKSYLDNGASFIILGEIEKTLNDLLLTLEKDEKEYPFGVVYKEFNQIKYTPKKENIKQLDDLKQPLWNLIDFDKYKNKWEESHGVFSINIVTSRGCPFKCNWCAKPIWGRNYYYHSPEYIVNQIKQILTYTKFEHIWFTDDIFGLKENWIEEFSQKVVENSLTVKYTIQSRADLMTKKTIKFLKESGCETVWLGVESGNQIILNSMDKELKLEDVYSARKSLQKNKIRCGFFIQLGYLNEDIQEINDTRNMIMELLPDEIGVSVSYPLPNTKFYEIVKNQIDKKRNWLESNDLDTIFKTTFKAEFYRKIRNHLYNELNDRLNNIDSEKVKVSWDKKWDNLMSESSIYYTKKEKDV